MPLRVTSVASDRVKAVRALQSRSGRRKAGRFIVEGPQAVGSALDAGVRVHEIFVAEDAGAAVSALVERAHQLGATEVDVTAAVMAAMGETEHPQGILAVCSLLEPGDLATAMARPGPVVVLESLADPGNVGTIIRTADAVGAAAVVLTEGSADVHNGKVVRSTAGSLFHLPVLAGCALSAVVDAARSAGRPVLVLAGEGDVDLFDAVREEVVATAAVWVVGAEAHGASEQARTLADRIVRIPMVGKAESLNAAVAAATCLYVAAFAAASRWQEPRGDWAPPAAG